MEPHLALALRQLRAEVPQPQRRVAAAAGKAPPVGAEAHAEHRLGVTRHARGAARDGAHAEHLRPQLSAHGAWGRKPQGSAHNRDGPLTRLKVQPQATIHRTACGM